MKRRRHKKPRNPMGFIRYITISEDNIVTKLFFAPEGDIPEGQEWIKINNNFKVEVGDEIEFSEDGMKVDRPEIKVKPKKSGWFW